MARRRDRLGGLLGCLGAILGRLGGHLGPSWGSLGASWAVLGAILGRPGGLLGPLGAVFANLEGSKPEHVSRVAHSARIHACTYVSVAYLALAPPRLCIGSEFRDV